MPRENTLFVGKFVHHFEELPSTNAYLQELVDRQKIPEGTVVLTDHQTAGRGQMGNTWFGGRRNNIALSVLLRPIFLEPRQQFQLTQCVALAVRDTLAEFLPRPVRIKWPNDVLVGDRKICGILIQNNLSGAQLSRSIVGIGVNVNQAEFPEEASKATSIFLETGRELDCEVLLYRLYENLEARYLQLRGGRTQALHADYIRQFYRLDQPTPFRDSLTECDFVGLPTGISERGELVVVMPDGRRRFFGMKEIKWR